jgi:hypothetical protein
MRILGVLAFVTSGCHLVFGSGPEPLPTDAASDGAVADASDAAIDDARPDARPDASGCVGTDHVATLVNDTFIVPDVWPSPSACSPSTRYGTSTTLNLGQAVGDTMSVSRVLLRFEAPVSLLTALAANHTLGGATLRLQVSNACPGCMSGTTTIDVHTLVNTWTEGDGNPYVGAGWCMKNGISQTDQISWGVPGADGPAERSPSPLAEITAVAPVPNSQISVPIPAATAPGISNWISGTQLSLILIAPSGGPLYMYSREGALSAPQAAPALTITTCEP